MFVIFFLVSLLVLVTGVGGVGVRCGGGGSGCVGGDAWRWKL